MLFQCCLHIFAEAIVINNVIVLAVNLKILGIEPQLHTHLTLEMEIKASLKFLFTILKDNTTVFIELTAWYSIVFYTLKVCVGTCFLHMSTYVKMYHLLIYSSNI